MKILYIAGESANWVINLCNEMCNQGNEVICVVQQLDEYDKENPVKEHKNLTRINVDYETMFSPDKIYNAVKSYDFDLVFGSHTPILDSVRYIAEQKNVKWGVMLLDIPTDLIDKEPFRQKQWNHWLSILQETPFIIFNTEVARNEYFNIMSIKFPDSNIITYATEIPEDLKMEGSKIKGDYIVSACRLTPMKNISMITKAIAHSKLPVTQIVIGRDRGDLKEIQKIAQKHNVKVIYKDMVSEKEKFELIKNSLCLAYPQYTEYIGGLSPWESMKIGKPTICSDFKVLKDLFKDNIEYFDRDSVEDFANKLKKVYKEEYNIEKLKKASDYAFKDASFNTMAKKMLNVFERMVR